MDRDTLLVPSGWDSWGKIRVLREGFDCRGLGRGWEFDCEVERVRRAKRLPRARAAEEEAEKEVEKEDEVVSAVRLFEDIVSDWEAGPVSCASLDLESCQLSKRRMTEVNIHSFLTGCQRKPRTCPRTGRTSFPSSTLRDPPKRPGSTKQIHASIIARRWSFSRRWSRCWCWWGCNL